MAPNGEGVTGQVRNRSLSATSLIRLRHAFKLDLGPMRNILLLNKESMRAQRACNDNDDQRENSAAKVWLVFGVGQ